MKTTELKEMRACVPGLKWALQYDTIEEAWAACEKGEYMLWFAQEVDVDRKLLTLTAARCAETVKHLMPKDSVEALEVIIRYGLGNATEDEFEEASSKAYDSTVSYYTTTAADYAANAVYSAATHAPYSAFSAAGAAAAAYSDFYASDDKKANEKQTADICRELLTDKVFEIIKK